MGQHHWIFLETQLMLKPAFSSPHVKHYSIILEKYLSVTVALSGRRSLGLRSLVVLLSDQIEDQPSVPRWAQEGAGQ